MRVRRKGDKQTGRAVMGDQSYEILKKLLHRSISAGKKKMKNNCRTDCSLSNVVLKQLILKINISFNAKLTLFSPQMIQSLFFNHMVHVHQYLLS
jgi:hypothetical protein